MEAEENQVEQLSELVRQVAEHVVTQMQFSARRVFMKYELDCTLGCSGFNSHRGRLTEHDTMHNFIGKIIKIELVVSSPSRSNAKFGLDVS